MQSSRKDQASLLLEAIRGISLNKEGAKEASRHQLEKELSECDAELTKFVTEHFDDLGNIMSTFEQMSKRIRESKYKMLKIRENLESCRKLLRYKRSELREDWIKAVEQRHITSLLDRISSVKHAVDKADSYMSKKYYLHAAEQLATARFQYKNELSRIEPLKALGAELDTKSEHLYQQLMEELTRQIYIRSPSSAIQMFHRHMSSRRSSRRGVGPHRFQASGRRGERPMGLNLTNSKITHCSNEDKSSQLDLAVLLGPVPQLDRPLQEDTSSEVNAEENQVKFIAILLEALGVMNQLKNATDSLQANLRNELDGVVKRATQQVRDTLDDDEEEESRSSSDPSAQSAWSAFVNPLGQNLSQKFQGKHNQLLPGSASERHRQALNDLIDLVFSQFKCVLAGHHLISELLEQARKSPAGVEAGPYSLSCVWSIMDNYLGQMVDLYVTKGSDKSPMPGGELAGTVFARDASASNVDVAPFFTKRKQGPTLGPVFRFHQSGQAQTMDTYMRQVRQQQYGTAGDISSEKKQLNGDQLSGLALVGGQWQNPTVCPPDLFNVAPLFGKVSGFVTEVVSVLDSDVPTGEAVDSSSAMITLHNTIAHHFIAGLEAALVRFLHDVPRALDGLRLVVVPSTSHADDDSINSNRSTRKVLSPFLAARFQLIQLTQLIDALPDFADPISVLCERCFQTLLNHARGYYERLARYRGQDAQQRDSAMPLTRAALIASDQDISRTFKTNAVWYEMERAAAAQAATPDDMESDIIEIVTRDDVASDLTREVDMVVQELRSESPQLNAHALQNRLCIGGKSCRSPQASDSLVGLARLGDSLYWFVRQLNSFIDDFSIQVRRRSVADVTQVLPEVSSPCSSLSNALKSIAGEMKQLADTCFLTLHLDTLLRTATFLWTGPLDQHLGIGASHATQSESDALVHSLETELSQLESFLSTNTSADHNSFDDQRNNSSRSVTATTVGGGLSTPKLAYIFAGVSRLAAVLLVRYAGSRCRQEILTTGVEPLPENILNKMVRTVVALQAAFSRVSGCNQADLDYARRYYELLYLSPSEVVQKIVSGGATQFSEREYDILLQLMQHSAQHHHIPAADFKSYRDQVRDLIVAKNKIMLQQRRQQQKLAQSAHDFQRQQHIRSSSSNRVERKKTTISSDKPPTAL